MTRISSHPEVDRLKFPNEDFHQTKGRTMFDVVKQAVFTGLGLASLTQEKAEQLAEEIAAAGQAL